MTGRSIPLTLRLLFHGFRSIMLGLTIMLVGWMSLTPATPDESAALGSDIKENRPEGLVQMRIARALIYFVPNRAAKMLSFSSGGEISVETAEFALNEIAQGPASREPTAAPEIAPEDPAVRQISGAKFVKVN